MEEESLHAKKTEVGEKKSYLDENGHIKPTPFNVALARPKLKLLWLARMAAEGKLSEEQRERCNQKIDGFEDEVKACKSELQDFPHGRYL